MTPDRQATAVRLWAHRVERQLKLVVFDVWLEVHHGLVLNLIAVSRCDRKQGVGSEALRLLCAYADQHDWRIFPNVAQRDVGGGAARGTTSRARLVRFYKRFGFYENKGRRKDFTVSYSMSREPIGRV